MTLLVILNCNWNTPVLLKYIETTGMVHSPQE